MAAAKISFVKTQGVWGFTALLVSIVCEWFLIILLLVDALLLYLLTKLASFCGLQVPCILCSRLEFALGGQKPELYQTLLCSNHRSEITSLISCHIHNKVADGGGMCDDCLLSFKTKTKDNSKDHRLLMWKLGLDHGDCSSQCPLKGDLFHGSSDSRPCTCCGSIISRCAGQNSRDSLSHVGFTELKLHSDSESGLPFSADDNNVSAVIHEINGAFTPKSQSTSMTSSKFLPSDSNPAEPEQNEAVDVAQASDDGLQSIRGHEGSLMKITKNAELFEKTDAASSNGAKILQKSVSLDSGLASIAESNVSKIDQLNSQIAYDKQFINSLHKELEEERNASAIAANEAMAMITKLQEDKAALRMESLQYLRMMEEQAEHDAVALERADDLLTEKEKLIQDLESELDFYRLNVAEEPMDENMHEESNHLNAANMALKNVGLPHVTNNMNSSCNLRQARNS